MKIKLPTNANPYFHIYTGVTISDIRKALSDVVKEKEPIDPFKGIYPSKGFIKAFDEAIKRELEEQGYYNSFPKKETFMTNNSFNNPTFIGFKSEYKPIFLVC